MPSPFPGMDPWLEDGEIFPNLHDRLLMGICDQLNLLMPEEYTAISKNRVWIDDVQRRDPDVSVFGKDHPPLSGGTATLSTMSGLQLLGGVPLAESMEEPYLEILSNKGRRLVTVVEILSVANKSTGRAAYLAKQQEYLAGGVNIVEIDLLRTGLHSTLAPREWLERLGTPDFFYHISATRPGDPPQVYGAVLDLAKPLPTIGIMLDQGVPSVNVELQSILDHAYEAGRYRNLVDYTQPPDPPLRGPALAWATERLRAAGMMT
ncbi:MAG: DUF4058 family protein [Fimbriiglobus sp.]